MRSTGQNLIKSFSAYYSATKILRASTGWTTEFLQNAQRRCIRLIKARGKSFFIRAGEKSPLPGWRVKKKFLNPQLKLFHSINAVKERKVVNFGTQPCFQSKVLRDKSSYKNSHWKRVVFYRSSFFVIFSGWKEVFLHSRVKDKVCGLLVTKWNNVFQKETTQKRWVVWKKIRK